MPLKLILFFVLAVFGLMISPTEPIASECGENGVGCRGLPVATRRAAATHGAPYSYRPSFIPSSREAPVAGCYGFDHGPFYSPHGCIIPYPCAYYGTCK
jgi:hypothetical protein